MLRNLLLIMCMMVLSYGNMFAQKQHLKQTQKTIPVDTIIYSLIDEVNADSIKSYIQQLQSYGTRYFGNENRKDIALWIAQKFSSWGYEVELDSFKTSNPPNLNDSLWQYNVVAKVSGSYAPDKVYILGGHYDAMNNDIIFNSHFNDISSPAPGADDNASGVAATMETARVFSQQGYTPPATVKFIAFAREELFSESGAFHYANDAKLQGENIQLMMNNDMISYNHPDSIWKIAICEPADKSSKWATELAIQTIEKYTLITPIKNHFNSSDSYWFWQHGFYVSYYFEYYFSPFYHQPSDTLGNYNMPYCAEVTKADIALLVNDMELPTVKYPTAIGEKGTIDIKWQKATSQRVVGYNIYKSIYTDNSFTKINSSVITDTTYTDADVERNNEYFYTITAVDNDYKESITSNIVSGSPAYLDQGILLVKGSKGDLNSYITPDSIFNNFYHQLLVGYNYHDYSAHNPSNAISATILSNYSTVIWHINSNSYNNLKSYYPEFIKYMNSGGNIFITGFNFTNDFISTYDYDPLPATVKFYTDYLQLTNTLKNTTDVLFNKATPIMSGFSAIQVDTTKTKSTNSYHLTGVNALNPINSENIIYTFGSNYSASSPEGTYVGEPVCVGNFNDSYNAVIMSFPLYYMEPLQAKAFIDELLHNRFNESLSVPEDLSNYSTSQITQLYPNPCTDNLNIQFSLKKGSIVKIALYNNIGIKVYETSSKKYDSGEHTVTINTKGLNFPKGLYVCDLISYEGVDARKFIINK